MSGLGDHLDHKQDRFEPVSDWERGYNWTWHSNWKWQDGAILIALHTITK